MQLEDVKKTHQQGQFEEAIAGYKTLLTQDPNNDEIHHSLALAYGQIQQFQQALEHIDDAVKLVPNSDRYHQFKGQMHLALGQLDQAQKSFKRSLKENPNLFFSYLAVGDIHAINNEAEKAKEQYQLALKVHSNGTPAITRLAKLLLIQGDYQAAQEELQKAELQWPDDPELKLQMGILKYEMGEHGFAELYFKKLLEDHPNHEMAKTQLAMSLLDSDPAQASQLANEQIQANIKTPELMVLLGLMKAKANQPTQAIQYLLPNCQSGLTYPSWLLALSQAYLANQQPNSAQDVLDLLLSRGHHERALILMGQIHHQNQNPAKAIECYAKVQQDPNLTNHARLRIAQCHYIAEDYAASLQQLDALLADQTDHNEAIKLKLHCLSRQSKTEEALKLIQSIDLNSQVPQFQQMMHLYAGLFHNHVAEYDQAWQHFGQLEHPAPIQPTMLSAEEEQVIQQLPSQQSNSLFTFLFSDPATGQHQFIQWLNEQGITPLLDRYSGQARADLFTQNWSVDMLQDMTDAQAHLWRKKYTKHVRQVLPEEAQAAVDCMPFSPMNVALIKRIFPNAKVLILTRNFADLRLHNRVFGNQQVHHKHFSKTTNQMIAMNPNVSLIDIDQWQTGDEAVMSLLQQTFDKDFTSPDAQSNLPLDQVMLPHMQWKHYQKQLND